MVNNANVYIETDKIVHLACIINLSVTPEPGPKYRQSKDKPALDREYLGERPVKDDVSE